MWSSTVGLVNGKHRYLTAETFGFKINSNGQMLKRRQQWTIEPFPENVGPDGSVSSAASVSSQCLGSSQQHSSSSSPPIQQQTIQNQLLDANDACILTFSPGANGSSLTSIRSSSNGSSASDQDNCGEEHENVAIKSHLNKYLAVDSFGNVTCDSDEKTENARFTITICSMSQGRSKDEHIFWAFRNVERGYYLGTTDDGMICCNAKMPKSRAELWHLHLLPARGASFFALKSLGRKRFARVASEEFVGYQSDTNRADLSAPSKRAQVQLDATISWGSETLFQFKYFEGGRYALLSSDCRYLTNEGQCIQWKAPNESSLPPAECLFTLEYHSGFLAFRDSFSHYLAAAGRSSVLRSRSIGVSRDELFVFECAPIQVSLKATFNNRWVSIKQGVDLSANQMETTQKFETFQLTYHKQTQNWSIMTQDCNFWTVSHNASTVSVCKPGDYEALNRGQFRLVWSDTDATCSLKFIDSNNRQERWISARKSGQLYLASANQAPVKFVMRFQNRTLLNLRPVDGSGFVGLKQQGGGPCSKQLEANKTCPDSIAIEYSEMPAMSGTDGLVSVDGVEKQIRTLPEVGPKPSLNSSNGQQKINMLNIRLNSTKMGQSLLERFNVANDDKQQIQQQQQQQQQQPQQGSLDELANTKEMLDCCMDGNNNDEHFTLTQNEASKTNGSVECASTPSVASIISSFSNAKITSTSSLSSSSSPSNGGGEQQQFVTKQHPRLGSSVSRLASSFEGGVALQQQAPATIQLHNNSDLDSASVVASSCSSGGSVISSSGATQQLGTAQNGTNDVALLAAANGNKTSLCDQVAQYECCYMKLISNERYLVASEKDSGVICDATNKACAQPWVLELRSHNCIAIRASDNHAYLQLGTNGTVFLSRCEPKEASLWEF